MEDQELLRYSKHIMLPQVDVEGQQKIMDSTVLIIGMGGLGSPSALYLAAAGVGHIVIADFDQVELSNLQRQIIHQTKDIGDDKVNSAMNKLNELNPNIKVTIANELIHTDNLSELIKDVDIVLDGTDNFESRFEINQVCVENQKPLISAAVVRFEGQVSVFKGYEKDQPCYQCLYSVEGEENERCIDKGGHTRTGMEDNIRISKNQLASSNAELVLLTKQLCSAYERPVANWKEARKILNIPLKINN